VAAKKSTEVENEGMDCLGEQRLSLLDSAVLLERCMLRDEIPLYSRPVSGQIRKSCDKIRESRTVFCQFLVCPRPKSLKSHTP